MEIGCRRLPSNVGMILRRIFDQPSRFAPWEDSTPLRAELFSVDRLEEHARSLAAAQPVRPGTRKGHKLAKRVKANAAFLLLANRALADAPGTRRQATPAAEWLIDNYHLVDMQIREIGIDLPPGYYLQLPKLLEGPFEDLPRVFGLVWSLVAHTDSQFEPETLRRYLTAYQEVQPLTIGELWAVPITMRIVLIEHLRRVAAMIVANAAARREADALADRLLGNEGKIAPRNALLEVVPGGVGDAFAVQLAHRLRGQDPREDPALC